MEAGGRGNGIGVGFNSATEYEFIMTLQIIRLPLKTGCANTTTICPVPVFEYLWKEVNGGANEASKFPKTRTWT